MTIMTGNQGMPELESIKGNNFTWTNIDLPNPEILNLIAGCYSFHHLDMEDCLSKTQLQKIEEYDNYLFIILHFPRFLKEKRFSIPVQVAVFLGKDFLVTVHNGELKPINNFFKKCADNGACPEYMGTSPAFLLYKLLYAVVENLMIMMGKVIFNIEELEERVFDEKTDAVREVTELRHNIANLRRIILPMKRVIHELEKKVQRFSSENMEIYFSDFGDLIGRAWTILDECKETIEIYKDTDFIISSDRTNKILTVLTILFTFSIPVTVIGTLYGMNVNLPGGADNPWKFFGPYTTFWIVLAVSTVPVFIMYLIFRRLRWL